MTLPESLLTPEKKPLVVKDCVSLIDSEVSKKSGFSGLAIKGGYAVVKKLDGGQMVPKAVNDLLPDFTEALEPYHAQHRQAGGPSFEAWSRGHEPELAEALLAVTDGKAKHAKHKTLKSIYEKLRPTAKRNLEASIGALAAVLDRHSA